MSEFTGSVSFTCLALMETLSHHAPLRPSSPAQAETEKTNGHSESVGQETIGVRASPWGLTDISGEQWLFREFSATDSSYRAIQETVSVRRGSESGSNQLNSFLLDDDYFTLHPFQPQTLCSYVE